MTKTTMQDRLRVDTAKWLKIDIETMTPAQEVKLDRCCVLRLQIEDMMAKKLAVVDAPFDAAKYILISEALERLVGGDHEQQHQPDFAGARGELLRFLDGRAAALEHKAKREAAALEASKQDMVPAYDPAAKAELALTDGRAPTSFPVAELMPEGQDPPPARPPVTYVDAGVLDAERYSRINGGHAAPATQRPSSPLTRSYFSPGNDLGGNYWATKNWSPRRGF